MIPLNYPKWRHCIEINCGIKLTRIFAEERLKAMQQKSDPFMLAFIRIYGEGYANQVISWYKRFLQELN